MVESCPTEQHTPASTTVVNSANWDNQAPASVLDNTIAFCANASVHVVELEDMGFKHKSTVGFSAKFNRQFCRCTSVLMLSKTSMLVSLDKRTIVWQQDIFETKKQVSVSVGDVVVNMAVMPKQSLTTKVLALTKHGILYRLTLSEQRGISLELLQKDRIPSPISACQINCQQNGDVVLPYGTEDGAVAQIMIGQDGLIHKETIGEFQKGQQVSGVLSLGANLVLATSKDGALMIRRDKQVQFVLVQSTNDAHEQEEEKSQKKTPPKTLQSYRLLQLSDDKVLISGKDGDLFILDVAGQIETQANFNKSLKLVSDNGHNMPILQLLNLPDRAFLSLSYDRTIVAWQVSEGCHFIDQTARLPTLGQKIDHQMVHFVSQDELLVLQNRPSSQKLLSLEIDDTGVIRTNDLTTAKILNRSGEISCLAVCSDEPSLVALVYEQSRLAIYDTLQKEIVKKYKPSHQRTIHCAQFASTESAYLVLQSSRDSVLELQELSLLTGKQISHWQTDVVADQSKLWLSGASTKIICYKRS